MRKVVNFCDYFVICSGGTFRHVNAIAEHISDESQKPGAKMVFTQKTSARSDWIVLDAGDVITHIFQKQVREFYALEYLWKEAKIVNWKED